MSIDIFDTRTMLPALEKMHKPKTFLLRTFFPNSDTADGKEVDIDIYKGKRKLAPFVRPTDEGKKIDNTGFTTNKFAPPYVKPKKETTAAELLKRSPGEILYSGGKTPQQRAQEKLGKDMLELTDMIIRRKEWMAAQALNAGKISVVGEGINAEIDFLRAADHTVTLTGDDLFTSANSQPLEILRQKKRKIGKDSGLTARAAVFGESVIDAFLKQANVKDQLSTRRIDLGLVKPDELEDGVTYWGYIEGLDIYTYEEYYLDDSEVLQPMVPVDKIFLGATNARASQLHGAIQDIEAIEQGLISVPYFPKSWVTKDPSVRWLMVQSAPLVCPHDTDAFMSIKAV